MQYDMSRVQLLCVSAQQHGLLCEVDSEDEDKELCDPFFAHCKAHAERDIAKRKVRLLAEHECNCEPCHYS